MNLSRNWVWILKFEEGKFPWFFLFVSWSPCFVIHSWIFFCFLVTVWWINNGCKSFEILVLAHLLEELIILFLLFLSWVLNILFKGIELQEIDLWNSHPGFDQKSDRSSGLVWSRGCFPLPPMKFLIFFPRTQVGKKIERPDFQTLSWLHLCRRKKLGKDLGYNPFSFHFLFLLFSFF